MKKANIPYACCALVLLAGLLFSVGAMGAEADPFVTVKDAEENLVSGARVFICARGVPRKVMAEGETNDEGRFYLPKSEENSIAYKLLTGHKVATIIAHKDGLSWGGITGRFPETENTTVHLTAPAKLAGRVTDRQGNPLEGALMRPVHVYHDRPRTARYFSVREGLPFLSARTNTEGKFLLEDLPAGSHVVLRIEAPPGYAALSTPNDPAYRPPEEDILLQLAPESRIKGTLMHEKTGKPVAGIRVYAPDGTGHYMEKR
jgi:hypothetical protein